MTQDITRLLHQPPKHYASARMLHGRTVTDADINEGQRLFETDQALGVHDIVGCNGVVGDGFRIGTFDAEHHQNTAEEALEQAEGLAPISTHVHDVWTSFNGEFPVPVQSVSILPGAAYLGGKRFVLDEAEAFIHQRDFLQMRGEDANRQGRYTLYYLRAWEQAVTAVEDGELLETALGGPDTSVRMRRMRRVERAHVSSGDCCESFQEFINELENATYDEESCRVVSDGRLRLDFVDASDEDLCTPDPPPQYVGTENQALRILLTSPSTFVWAYDNAAPLLRVERINQLQFRLLTPPVDAAHAPRPEQVAELVPFAAVLPGPARDGDPHSGKIGVEVGVFVRIQSFVGGVITFDEETDLASLNRMVTRWSNNHPEAEQLDSRPTPMFLRLWHQAPNRSDIEIPTNREDSLGRSGIVPKFLSPGRRGDYWVAALRTDARDRIVPFDLHLEPAGVPPHGPVHYLMPLAVLEQISTTSVLATDCRLRLRTLTDTECATVTVGDGVHSVGDFATIQAAIDSLPPSGGRVEVRPGVYPEEVDLTNRKDVILEGCGDGSVIQSPDGTLARSGVVDVSGSENVSVRHFQIQATDQAGIFASSAESLRLTSLSVLTVVHEEGGPEAGTGGSVEALVNLTAVNHLTYVEVDVVSLGRPAVTLTNLADGRLEDFSAVGDGEGSTAPTPSLFLVTESTDLSLRRGVLRAFGQKPLVVRSTHYKNHALCRNHLLEELDVFSGEWGGGASAQPAVTIEHASDIRLSRCQIALDGTATENCAVEVKGYRIEIWDNRIETPDLCLDASPPADPNDCQSSLAVAWGGLHIRGLSEEIEIARNTIIGGLGHAITLGSVIWKDDPASADFVSQPVGRAQLSVDLTPGSESAYVTGDLSAGYVEGQSTFLPTDEGPLQRIVIRDNHIEQSATNGISVLSVLGLDPSGQEQDFMEVRRLRIEGNTISGNLRQIAEPSTLTNVIPLPPSRLGDAFGIQILPLGGIVLGTLSEGAVLRDNRIVGNGSSAQVPTSGIFVLNGDGIDISKNHIADNGGIAQSSLPLSYGVRAGIAVMLAGTDSAASSEEIDEILDVDVPPTAEARSMSNAGFALRVVGNTVRQPEGRALHAVTCGWTSVNDNFLSSQGYHGSESHASDQFGIGDVVFVEGLAGPVETINAADLPSDPGTNDDPPSEFQDYITPGDTRDLLANSDGGSPRLFVGAGGGISFSNNQVIYDWAVKRPGTSGIPISFFPVVVMGQDHVAALDNNLATLISDVPAEYTGHGTSLPEPLFAHALFGAATVQAVRNRIAGTVSATRLSLITAGELLNTTAFNICTHPTIVFKWSAGGDPDGHDYLNRDNNHAIFTHYAIDSESERVSLINSLVGPVRALFRLLHDPSGPAS